MRQGFLTLVIYKNVIKLKISLGTLIHLNGVIEAIQNYKRLKCCIGEYYSEVFYLHPVKLETIKNFYTPIQN